MSQCEADLVAAAQAEGAINVEHVAVITNFFATGPLHTPLLHMSPRLGTHAPMVAAQIVGRDDSHLKAVCRPADRLQVAIVPAHDLPRDHVRVHGVALPGRFGWIWWGPMFGAATICAGVPGRSAMSSGGGSPSQALTAWSAAR
ncbi:hypothetical protein [Mycolicibacterium llatzerense]|uniref:hypothetical protein n=1 Tax=Mycolicibacterium llatzerense TaxID=280871 RepID=UPI0021B638E1|nr:hypothetical protein [Mycolicibacterium llatzerense]MCT7364586.1 hypothetical protein [Mycolicibacterium llatzerense]